MLSILLARRLSVRDRLAELIARSDFRAAIGATGKVIGPGRKVGNVTVVVAHRVMPGGNIKEVLNN